RNRSRTRTRTRTRTRSRSRTQTRTPTEEPSHERQLLGGLGSRRGPRSDSSSLALLAPLAVIHYRRGADLTGDSASWRSFIPAREPTSRATALPGGLRLVLDRP